ncbi:hypothetical protein AO263_27970 [Pseudomonas sp. NZIPFR-PS5]|nr:hypothetical protein AO263_27970 [Pseudomonas sp. NZIPFR-PS5]
MCRSMQAELSGLAQHPISPDVLLNTSKFNAKKKRLTQPFLALEGQDVERKGQTMNNKLVATVIKERRQHGEHE